MNFIFMNKQNDQLKISAINESNNKIHSKFFMNSGTCKKIIQKVKKSPKGHQYVNGVLGDDKFEKVFLIGFENDFDLESANLLIGKEIKLQWNSQGDLFIKHFSTLPKATRDYILAKKTENDPTNPPQEENIYQSPFNYLANEILLWVIEWLIFSHSYQKQKNKN